MILHILQSQRFPTLLKHGFKEIKLIGWLTVSPNNNPRENLYSIIKINVYENGNQYSSKGDLWEPIRMAARYYPNSQKVNKFNGWKFENFDSIGWLISMFNGISTLVSYLMPKPFSEKNSSCTIWPIAGRIRGFIPFPWVFGQKWT